MVIGQWPNRESIRLPLIVAVEIVATRCVDSKFVVGREVRWLIGDGQSSGGRRGAEVADLFCIQLSQSEDDRLVAESLLIVDEEGVSIGWAEQSPAIDELDRAVELRGRVESVDEQIAESYAL